MRDVGDNKLQPLMAVFRDRCVVNRRGRGDLWLLLVDVTVSTVLYIDFAVDPHLRKLLRLFCVCAFWGVWV